jgi:eukaryotic-like serine/threonine-protein kinase
VTAPQLARGAGIAGKYQVGSLLGQGGSSNTYYCAAAGNREVVVKLFDPAMRQRADIMQLVEQTWGLTNALPEGAAHIIDAGYEPTSGAPFSVTERVPMASLAQLLGQRALTPEETMTMVRAMARVLDAAHATKLCHHALKPTNVFLQPGAGLNLRLTDFGANLPRLAVPTQEGYTLAAPWLAPEQVQQGVQAGPAADVFATALLIFYALTGRSYWRSCQGATDVAGWQHELMAARELPSARAAQLGVQLNPSLDPILLAALSVDPGQRFRSVGELATAFEGLVSQRLPENAATMAFPSNMGGDYPPPPAPLAGQGAPGGYAPAQPAPAQQTPYGGTAQPVGPGGKPSAPAPARPTSTRVAPIVVGVVAVLLVGGAVAAFVVMGKKSKRDDTGPIAVPTATSAPAPATSATAETTAAATAAGTAPSAEPAASGSASAAPAEADAGPAEVEVAITCEPACDEIRVDDKLVEDKTKPLMLTPGKHKVSVAKTGYVTQTEFITVKPGEKFEKQFALVQYKAGASKPCGKFLKRCN